MKILSLAFALTASLFAPATLYLRDLYPKTLIITKIDGDNITLKDSAGYLWEVEEDPEDWEPGDCVSAIFYNNGTPNLFDDCIVKMQYERVDLLTTD